MRVTHPRRLACVWLLAVSLVAVAARAEEPAPRVVIDAPVHDFGSVEQGATVEHVFRLRNAGQAALRVDHVKGTCACTVGVATGDAVPPGDEAWVTVTLDTARLAGRTTKTVTVYTNDPAAPTVGVTLTGQVLTDLVVNPTPLYLGHVRRGTGVQRELTVTPGRPGTIVAVVSVESAHPSLHARLEPAPDGVGQRVVVDLDADVPLGRFTDELVLRTTSERQPRLAVKVFGTIEGEIAVLPPQVTFGVAQGESGDTRELFIHNRGTRPVSVTRVTVPDAVRYELSTVEEGVEYRLALQLRDDLPPGKIEGAVEIFTSHPDEQRVTVPLYAVVRPAGRRG